MQGKNLRQANKARKAVIITALPVEYNAVHAYLTHVTRDQHEQGTIYEVGDFLPRSGPWKVAILEIGAGNTGAALESERAINYFKPEVILFVGVAGGLKDVKLGDVVAATKVYLHESGKSESMFYPRPELGRATYRMEQLARAESKKKDWLRRIKKRTPSLKPNVYVGPIAAGEKLVRSTASAVCELLKSQYGDALAVEMEGYGFLKAADANQQVEAIVIRGISDLIDDKSAADASGSQVIASRHASAFAFHLLARLGGNAEGRISIEHEKKRQYLSQANTSYDLASIGFLSDVKRHGDRAREGLEPHILPRIPRRNILDRYILGIKRSLKEGKKRLIPIISPAGYGKSTILGTIYDELIRYDDNWVALVRCNDLKQVSIETLTNDLGEGVCGFRKSIAEIGASLTAQHGKGVLLIDTLDLILNERLVPVLRSVLLQLLENEVTVVFTCRDHEYGALLEPIRERLAGLAEHVDRYEIPKFTSNEIEEATLRFIQLNSQPTITDGGQAFAKSILDLSADNRSISEIAHNPLLLALLCDLFGKDGHVPKDLTVSRLYDKYWEEKVIKSRKHGQNSPEAFKKAELCQQMAQTLFELSSEHLRESMYLDDIKLIPIDIATSAFKELLSEGIIKPLPAGRIHFFHQTFLEYAIARWLATRLGEKPREMLLNTLNKPGLANTQLYWWPVIRQLFSIVDTDEFNYLANKLDMNNLAAFRAVAFACASRNEPSTIYNLLVRALELGGEYQDTLREAAESMPLQSTEIAWDIMVRLINQGEWPNAVKAAYSAGVLIARRGRLVGHRLGEALDAISERVLANYENDPRVDSQDNRTDLIAWLLAAPLDIGKDNVDPIILRNLRDHYFSFREVVKSKIVALHLTPGVSEEDKISLLTLALSEPVGSSDQKKELTSLLEQLIPTLIASGEFGWTSLMDVLHAQLPTGWEKAQSRAVGRHLVQDDLIAPVLRDIFQGNNSDTYRGQIAIDEAIRHGMAKTVCYILLAIPIESIPLSRSGLVGSLIKSIGNHIDSCQKEALADWAKPLASDNPDRLIDALAVLANASANVCHIIVQLVMSLPENKRVGYINKVLRSAPDEAISTLAASFKKEILASPNHQVSKLTLVNYYRALAKQSADAVLELIKISIGDSQKIAKAASNALVELIGEVEWLTPKKLLPLAKSRFVGVRLHWLEALTRIIDRNLPLEDEDLLAAVAVLQNETQVPILQGLFNLVTRWVRANRRGSLALSESFGKITLKMLKQKKIDNGTLRSLIITLKAIAQSEEKKLPPQFGEWVRALLWSVDVGKIRDGESEAIDLLSAIARVDTSFLPSAIQDCSTQPTRNVRAIASAIKRVEGINSPLLEHIMKNEGCAQEVKSLILEFRRA